MKAKCSKCNGGTVWSRPYPGGPLSSRKCAWCDGLTWIPYERFKNQVESGLPEFKVDIDLPAHIDQATIERLKDTMDKMRDRL